MGHSLSQVRHFTLQSTLAAILASNGIPKVIIVRMEVPCCGGLTRIVQEAARRSGRTDLVVEEATIGLDGELKEIKQI